VQFELKLTKSPVTLRVEPEPVTEFALLILIAPPVSVLTIEDEESVRVPPKSIA
jgi:hypothetical protein